MSDNEHPPIDFAPLKHGQFCWTEIASGDAARSMEFFSNVFGWKFKTDDGAGGMAYNEFTTVDEHQPAGGLYQIDPAWFGDNPPPPHFMQYVFVEDVDRSAQEAVTLGATLVRDPMDIPGVGRMAVLADPTGAHISLFRWRS